MEGTHAGTLPGGVPNSSVRKTALGVSLKPALTHPSERSLLRLVRLTYSPRTRPGTRRVPILSVGQSSGRRSQCGALITTAQDSGEDVEQLCELSLARAASTLRQLPQHLKQPIHLILQAVVRQADSDKPPSAI